MKKPWKNYRLILLIVTLLISVLITGCAQKGASNQTSAGAPQEEYPTKPVQVIIAFPPGGETDVVGRMIMNYAQEHLGQNFVVINKPGASGEVGWGELAKAKPDGYTIGMVNPPTFVQTPIKKGAQCQYALDQFAPIANASTDPGAIVVLKDYPVNDLKELVALAKEKPGKILVGTGGAGTSEALALKRISRETGAEFKEVPFDGTANMKAALQGGHIDVAVMNVSSSLDLVNQGTAKVLGVGSLERNEHLPDIQTYIEQGIDVEQFSMRGFVAPAGTDPAIIEKLNNAIAKVFENEDFLKKAKEANLILDYQDCNKFKETLEFLDKSNREEWEAQPW